jgi:hypothetical protein
MVWLSHGGGVMSADTFGHNEDDASPERARSSAIPIESTVLSVVRTDGDVGTVSQWWGGSVPTVARCE